MKPDVTPATDLTWAYARDLERDWVRRIEALLSQRHDWQRCVDRSHQCVRCKEKKGITPDLACLTATERVELDSLVEDLERLRGKGQ